MPSTSYTCHGDYEMMAEKWERARLVIAGEDAVKDAGQRFLPKLPEQTDSEYIAYRDRAKFFNATGRTAAGLTGLLFRKEPVTKADGELKVFKTDCNLAGTPLDVYAKSAAKDVVGVGRAGTAIDWEESEKRPWFAFYKTEDIIDWEMRRVAGKTVLARVVLHECVQPDDIEEDYDPNSEAEAEPLEKLLVLYLDANGLYAVDVWQLMTSGKKKKQQADKWTKIETRTPTRAGARLDFIPFVFHVADADDMCCKPPLDDIISVNLHHYRLSADYNHSLHFSACPTAWVAGFPKTSKLAVGSSIAWVSENVEAKAGYLEFSGQGLQPIRDALTDDKTEMAVLGARLLEEQKRDSEAADTVRLRQTGEASILTNISDNLSSSLTKALKMAAWWMAAAGVASPEDVDDEVASVRVNKDFVEAHMTSDELTALTSTWLQGGISRNTLTYNLRRGELIPPDVTDEEERALIEADMPALGELLALNRPPPPQPPPGDKGAAKNGAAA